MSYVGSHLGWLVERLCRFFDFSRLDLDVTLFLEADRRFGALICLQSGHRPHFSKLLSDEDDKEKEEEEEDDDDDDDDEEEEDDDDEDKDVEDERLCLFLREFDCLEWYSGIIGRSISSRNFRAGFKSFVTSQNAGARTQRSTRRRES